MRRLNYAVGDWFAVPLREAGFAVGVVARAQPGGGVLFGYFFGPQRPDVPRLGDVAHLTASDAVLVGQFGHLGLQKKKWPNLGRLANWDPQAWPMPAFVRHEELTGRTLRVIYADDDPNKRLRTETISPADAYQGPEDGLMGDGFVEIRLTKLLAQGQK